MAKNSKKSKKTKAVKAEQAKQSINEQEMTALAEPAAKAETPETAAPKTEKKPASKVGRKPLTAAEKAAAAKERAEKKKLAENMTPTLTMQYGGRDVDVKALVQAAKDDFKAAHKRTLLISLDLYLKPEDSTLYYVANGSVEGKVTF